LAGDALAVFLLLARHLRDLGHEVAHLADLLLGFFLTEGLDGVLDLAAGRVHGLELEGRHNSLPHSEPIQKTQKLNRRKQRKQRIQKNEQAETQEKENSRPMVARSAGNATTSKSILSVSSCSKHFKPHLPGQENAP